MASGLFVVAMTTTRSKSGMFSDPPSKIASIVATILDDIIPSPPDWLRDGAMASSSSRRMTLGAASIAARKTARSASSLSPRCALTSSGPLTTNSLAFDACAAARARRVFPDPGGP